MYVYMFMFMIMSLFSSIKIMLQRVIFPDGACEPVLLAVQTRIREELNAWISESGDCDGERAQGAKSQIKSHEQALITYRRSPFPVHFRVFEPPRVQCRQKIPLQRRRLPGYGTRDHFRSQRGPGHAPRPESQAGIKARLTRYCS